MPQPEFARAIDARDPMREVRALLEPRVRGRIVEAEQARPRPAVGGRRRVGVGGDHFEIRAAPQAEQAIVRAHRRVRAAARGFDAERVGDVRDAFFERARGDDEMIECQ